MSIRKSIISIHALLKGIGRTWGFKGSKTYWESRYAQGDNSGGGSYNNLALFKAEVINEFIRKNNISTVIEFGCGDGNQLSLAEYKEYIGFDVSETAIELCKKKFLNDNSKSFLLTEDLHDQIAQLTMSLDVIFHLVESEVFEEYMKNLFGAATDFVIIYASNFDKMPTLKYPHVRHWNFTKWVEENASEWKLAEVIKNKYPFNGDAKVSSFSDFYIYERIK